MWVRLRVPAYLVLSTLLFLTAYVYCKGGEKSPRQLPLFCEKPPRLSHAPFPRSAHPQAVPDRQLLRSRVGTCPRGRSGGIAHRMPVWYVRAKMGQTLNPFSPCLIISGELRYRLVDLSQVRRGSDWVAKLQAGLLGQIECLHNLSWRGVA